MMNRPCSDASCAFNGRSNVTKYGKFKQIRREQRSEPSEESEYPILPHGFRRDAIRTVLDHSDQRLTSYLAFAMPPTTSVR